MDADIRPDAIDTRLAFMAYAMVAGVLGIMVAVFGPTWPSAMGPLAPPDVARLVGAVLIGAAFMAVPFAAAESPIVRRRGLLALAGAHGVPLAVLALHTSELPAGWVRDAPLALLAAVTLLSLYLGLRADGEPLFEYGRGAIRVFGREERLRASDVRSRYEEQIRNIAAQEERHRLARDLHDSVKQQLFAIHTAAATAQVRMASDVPGTIAALEQVRALTRDAMAEMEAMLDQLRAAPLEVGGLVSALRVQCDALQHRTGATVVLQVVDVPDNARVAPGMCQGLYRVAQEALANVARHARAAHVHVRLSGTSGVLHLVVEDDGSGFDAAATHKGAGLANMRARAAEMSGELQVTSRPGGGTAVSVGVPLAPDRAEAASVYLRRTLWWGLVLVVTSARLVWDMAHTAGVSPSSAAVVALSTLVFGRELYAWIRLRRKVEVRS